MKLRLPSLLRRLLIAATTVTSVTIGSSNSYGAITNSDVSQSTYTDFGQDTDRYRTEADDDALLTRISELLSDDAADSTDGQESYTLGGLSLDGDFIEQADDALAAETDSALALNITDAVQSDALTVLQAGGVPTEAGDTVANVNAGGVDVAAQESAAQTFALARTTSETSEQLSSGDTTEDELYLALSETADSNVWAGDADNNTWSSTQFSVYGTSQVGAEGTACFDITATNKSVNVSETVSVGGMSISGGGYSFGGAGSIALSGQLSVSAGGDASTIDKIYIPTGPIAVDGSELTIVQLTPTNPSAPIALSNGAKLTIGDDTHRYGAFSGKVTGDAGSQLHLFTWQADGTDDHNEDGRVHLLDGSTVQDVYVHGHLALNMFDGSGSQSNLQEANLHMDAGSQLVVRNTETTLAPTTGDIVMHGDLSLQVYGKVEGTTTLNTDFTLADGVSSGTLKKIDGGSITLSGDINVSGIAVQAGTLKLTGSSITSSAYSVSSEATLQFSGAADSAAASSALVNATGAGNLTLDGVNATWAYDNASELTGKLTIRNATLTSDGFDGDVDDYKSKTTYDLSSFTSVELDNALVKFVGNNPTWQNVKVASGGAEFSIRDMNTTDSSAFIFSGTTTLEGTLKLSTTGWKSQINIASLTGSGDINVVGAGEYVRVKINSTSNYTGDIAVSGNKGRLILENSAATSYGSTGATVTLSGANLWMNGTGALTLNSTLVVNNTAATADAPSTSVLRNNSGAESLVRTLAAVQIKANNTLELQQSGWNTIWIINDLSGEGNLLWTSATNHWTPSRLVLSGDGSDFTGNIKLNRTGGAENSRKYQIYMEVAANDAVKGATLDLVGNATNNVVSLAINANAVTMQGLKGNEHTHLYAGASPIYVGSSDADSAKINAAFASTANNTLTLAGGDTYEFKGTVGTANETAHLNLAMTGSGTQTFSGVAHVGDVSVSAGKLALSNTGSKVHGDIAVSGGALDFDGTYTLSAGQSLSISTATSGAASLAALVLAGGEIIFDATALRTDTAALSVDTVSQTQGSSIIFNNEGQMESGRYMLAAGNWTAGGELSFTSSGLSNGSATFVSTDSGLYMDYVSSLLYTWDAGNGSWHDTNWDTTPDGTAAGNMAFVADKVAIFETDANVTISEAVSASKLIVRDGASVSLTETAALSAAAIEVAEGSTLSFATAKKASTIGSVSGTGTIGFTQLVNDNGAEDWGLTLRLEGFEGTTYVKAGKFDLYNATAEKAAGDTATESADDNVAQLGSTLHLGSGAHMQITSNKTVILNANLILDVNTTGGADSTVDGTEIHNNGSASLTVNGTVTGEGTWRRKGGGTLTFTNTVDLGGFNVGVGTNTFNAATTLDMLTVSGGTVNFNGTTDITTATISNGTTTFNGTTDITTATISGGSTTFKGDLTVGTLSQTGGTVTLWNTAAGSGAQKLIDKVVLGNEVTLKQYSAAVPNVYTHLGTVELSGAKATIQETNYGGAISIGTLNTGSTSGTSQLVLDFNHSADNFSLVKLGSATADAGNFAGTITMSGTNNGDMRGAALIIENADIAKNAVIDIALPSSTTAEYVVGINAANTTIAGLNSTSTYTDAEGNEQTRTNQYTLFSGSINPGQRDDTNNNKALSFNSGWIQNAGKRTLTLNVAEGGDYTFTGTVFKTDASVLSLVKTGAGSQTFSGVANVGDVSVSNGALVLSNEASEVNGDITVSGGRFTLGSSYTLGSGDVLSVLTGVENAVTLGGIVLAGGEMTFDASALQLTTAENATAALTLGETGTATVGEGSTGATVTLDFSKLSGALATGDYLLATGNWEGAALTYNGSGSTTLTATSTGLVLNYINDSVYTWVGGATLEDGTTADTAWSSANWDLIADTDASNNASWATGKDAIFNTDATVSVSNAVTAGAVSILNSAQVTLGQSGDAPSLTVDSLLVADGKLTLGSAKDWNGIKDITIKQDGILELAYGTGLRATHLQVQGGTIRLLNGGGTHGHLNAAMTVDGMGTIAGSLYGDGTTIAGSISGHGELHFTKVLVDEADGTKKTGTNIITVSSTISDDATGPLAVYIDSTKVEYNNAKSYTGGTTIGATGELTISGGGGESGALQGTIDVYGKLYLNTTDVTGWSTTQGVKVINVYDDGTLNVNTTSNQTGAGIAINLQGGTMTGAANSNFDLGYGGSVYGNSSINGLAADDASAENITVSSVDTVKITLRQYTTKFNVEEFAQLNISSVIQNNNKSILNSESNPGSSTFTKTGLGELVLSGQNTFTYATTVQAGTLTLANGGALDSAVTVNEGASFKLLADTAAVSYGKAISGAGTVVKAGANVATLSAANLSLTALDIQGGFVKATGGMSIGTLTAAAGTGFVFDLSGTPAVVTAGGYNGAITFRLDNMATGTYNLFQGAAGLNSSQVTLTGYDTNTYQTTTGVSEDGLVSIGVYYTGLVWNTAGATDAWNTTDANWNTAATAATYTAGSKVTFAGTGETVTIDGTVAPGDVHVRGTGYSLSGGTIASTGSLTVHSGAGLTLNQAATFAGGVTVDGALGYNVAAGQEINFTGTLAGSGSLNKTGAGTLNLGALNSSNISTTLNVSEGVLKFTGSDTEQHGVSSDFVNLINKLNTSGTGKVLIDGVVNYTDNQSNPVITIDDTVEITGRLQINSVATTNSADGDGYRKYVLADGADLTVGDVLWLTNKQKMVVQTGAVLNANGGIKLGHNDSGQNYTARFVVEGGEVKTTGITFRRDGNPRTGNAFIMTGGRVEFAPTTATTNVIQKLNDGDNGTGAIVNGEVSLTGGTLVAGESSWTMDAGSATNFHVYGVTFETAADKSITLAGNINFTPAEGANGTITKTGEGLLVFNVAGKTLTGLDIQGGWVQAGQAITLSTLTLAEGAGFAYDLSSTPAIITSADYTGELNFRLDNLAVGNYALFQGTADGTWTNDNVTLSGYNPDMFDVTVSSNAGLVSISVVYAGLLWDTAHSDTNTWVATDGESTWNAGEGTENVVYAEPTKAIFAGTGEEITISGTVTPGGITVSGTGYVFVGEGGIGGSGKLTVENGGELTISTANTYTGGTVIAEGGTLTITKAQALGASSADNVLGKVSGAGTLVVELGDASTRVYATGTGDAANLGAFTGTVNVQSGIFQAGAANTSGTGASNTMFSASKVIVGADGEFITHFGYGSSNQTSGTKEFNTDIDLMDGAVLGNIDGHINFAGIITVDGTVEVKQYWGKTLTFSGLLQGDGEMKLTNSYAEKTAKYSITGDANTYTGTFKTEDVDIDSNDDGERVIELRLGSQTAAQYADINLASTTSKSYLLLDSDATINGLYGGNAVQAQGDAGVTRTLTVSEGNYSGILCNYSPAGEAARVLALTKQGNGTLTLSGANSYTGATKVNAGTLELAGAVSMNAASDISVVNGATLLLNATNSSAAMTLGNDITGSGTIHKKGTYETVLSGDVTATLITVKDHQVDDKTAQNKTDAGTLTLTGSTVKADTLYAAYGTVNVGSGTNSTFMQVGRIEAGDSASTDGNATLNVKSGSTLTVTGSKNTEGYKDASLLLGEWEHGTKLNVAGTLLAPNAKAMVGDNVANITIENGGVMAVKGISVADTTEKTTQTQEIMVTLNDGGTLILGDAGITTYKKFTGNLGAGTVGMSAGSTTIAEDVTLTSDKGTTFDTTQYAYETNADGVATGIARGTEGGEMTISGNISSADDVEAKMKVAGAGSLTVSGATNTLSGGLEVEKDATLKLNTVASVTSQNSTDAATMTGAVSITTAEGITKLAGAGDKPATMNNSLVTIAQGASLTVENMMVSSTSRIIGEAVAEATYAMRSTAALSALKTANTTVELTDTNAAITGEGENITMQTRDISLKQTGAENSLTLNDAKVLTVTSDALSNLSIAAGSSLHISLDYDALFASIEGGLTDIDLLALSFENVSFENWTTTTITGSTGGYQLTAYYETVENAATNATTVFFDVQAVPEPTTTTLSILALAALVARRRRK